MALSELTLRYDWWGPHGPLPNGLNPRQLHDFAGFGDYTKLPWSIVKNLPVCNSWFRLIMHRSGLVYSERPTMDFGSHSMNDVYMLEPFASAEHYLGMLSGPPFDVSVFHRLSPLSLQRIRDGNLRLFINYSHEGATPAEFKFEELHRQLRFHKIPVSSVRYVVGELNFEKKYADWCAAAGETEAMSIVSWPFEIFHWQVAYPDFIDRSEDVVQPEEDRTQPREKYFLAFNNKPHPHRVALASLLMEAGLADVGFISFPEYSGMENGPGSWSSPAHAFSDKYPEYARVSAGLEMLKKRAPLRIDAAEVIQDLVAGKGTADLYRRSYFSLIAETQFCDEMQYMISEKTIKAIVNFHPFILASTPGSLKQLQELGYKTFSPFIDERYDDILSSTDRLLAITEQVQALCSKSREELSRWTAELAPILEHNRRHFFELLSLPYLLEIFDPN
jgi:hypothetical protein